MYIFYNKLWDNKEELKENIKETLESFGKEVDRTEQEFYIELAKSTITKEHLVVY